MSGQSAGHPTEQEYETIFSDYDVVWHDNDHSL